MFNFTKRKSLQGYAKNGKLKALARGNGSDDRSTENGRKSPLTIFPAVAQVARSSEQAQWGVYRVDTDIKG